MPILRDRVVSERFEIDAPVDEVWKLLTDFENYPNWNPFTEEVSTSMEPGTPVVMKVNLFPPRSMKQVETFESHIHQRELVWGIVDRPWFMRAKRTQRIEPLSDNKCT